MKLTAIAAAAGCLLAAGLAGCGEDAPDGSSPVADGGYAGRLYVSSEGLDGSDPIAKMGAAGEVVECSTPMTGGFNDPAEGPYDNGSPASTAEGAIESALDEWGFDGARDGFELAAEEDDRALYTYEVDGVVKQALILHDGPTISEDGWYLESWARCDLAEFPADVAAANGAQIWTDAAGRPVATTEVVSFPGPEHCDWQSMTFLSMGDDRFYIGNLDPEYLDYVGERPREGIPLPDSAVDTGYERDGKHLWLSSDDATAYVGSSPRSVDLWPMADKGFACA